MQRVLGRRAAKTGGHYLPVSSSGETKLCSARSMKQIALSGTGFVASPSFLFRTRAYRTRRSDGAQSEKRLVAVDYLNAVAVESLPEFYMRRLAGTARRGKSYALPVK